jgi:hypothetical protein
MEPVQRARKAVDVGGDTTAGGRADREKSAVHDRLLRRSHDLVDVRPPHPAAWGALDSANSRKIVTGRGEFPLQVWNERVLVDNIG